MNKPTGAASDLKAVPEQIKETNGQHAVRPAEKPRSLADVLRDVIGILDGPPDLAEQHDHYAHGTPKR